MMYLKGTITTVPNKHYCYAEPCLDKPRYVCRIKTPRIHVTKSSSRSRMEALTSALKIIGLPL